MSRLSFLLVILAACLCHLTSAFLPVRTSLPAVSRAALQPRSSSPGGRRKSVAVMAQEYWEVRFRMSVPARIRTRIHIRIRFLPSGDIVHSVPLAAPGPRRRCVWLTLDFSHLPSAGRVGVRRLRVHLRPRAVRRHALRGPEVRTIYTPNPRTAHFDA